MASTRSQARSTPADRSRSRAATNEAGIASCGTSSPSLRAMGALAATSTPAYTGPSKSTDARHRSRARGVVGEEERGGDLAEHADLVADVHEVGPRGRLDLTHDVEHGYSCSDFVSRNSSRP